MKDSSLQQPIEKPGSFSKIPPSRRTPRSGLWSQNEIVRVSNDTVPAPKKMLRKRLILLMKIQSVILQPAGVLFALNKRLSILNLNDSLSNGRGPK